VRAGTTLGAFSLTKSERLLSRADFEKLSNNGNRIDSDYFVILYSKNGLGKLRLGVTVSKRVGRAVIRNRVKRLVREYFRLHKTLFSDSYDVNIIAKGGTPELSSRQIRGALETICRNILRDCKHEAVSAGTH
jgi:ribonuclease P protein component